ncbi:hypothetical protein BH11BAC7_BH11BAC7_26250 [soil metagenome]
MTRDKSKDDKLFNCGQQFEHDYVASLYDTHEHRQKVRAFLTGACQNNTIYHSTHHKVYLLIQQNLGYPIPN